MTIKHPISALTIHGFKSIRALEQLELSALNVLIGPNGAGKSSFIAYFRMVGALMERRLANWTAKQGSAERIVSFGLKQTSQLDSTITLGHFTYSFTLEPSVDGTFVFTREAVTAHQQPVPLSTLPGPEATLPLLAVEPAADEATRSLFNSIHRWNVFHFHDTSETAGVKRWGDVHDALALHADGANLAAYLYMLRTESPAVYAQIRKTVQLAIPFFDDFVLQPRSVDDINLRWRQLDSDYVLSPHQLSDGSLRFICLATALLDPKPPSTLIIDEPELGLHPYAVTLLAALLRSASTRTQIIVATQSVELLNQFSLNDVIVVEREDGSSVFKRLQEADFADWLRDYSNGELWQKNVLGGRP
ncbi:AAA family ATPase [Amantichitinum ursilacus]|uniref:ATPase AAA-type core domain-containing protein n=1 Tax=Amantichitinum ursilacus TaxID=857265 RepID=A0A0N0XGR2_9NEIS|nr:AAA family ATPase [Amantichitinum ursilacus]KPC50409.1 hypothetical protein WG78_17415 [Amantichitinum ursilacus]